MKRLNWADELNRQPFRRFASCDSHTQTFEVVQCLATAHKALRPLAFMGKRAVSMAVSHSLVYAPIALCRLVSVHAANSMSAALSMTMRAEQVSIRAEQSCFEGLHLPRRPISVVIMQRWGVLSLPPLDDGSSCLDTISTSHVFV